MKSKRKNFNIQGVTSVINIWVHNVRIFVITHANVVVNAVWWYFFVIADVGNHGNAIAIVVMIKTITKEAKNINNENWNKP